MQSSTQAVKRPGHWGTLALCLLGLLLVGSPRPGLNRNATRGALPKESHAPHPTLIASYGKLPLSFEANQGQADPQVKVLSRGRGYTLLLAATEIVLSLNQPQRAADVGATPRGRPSSVDAGPSGRPHGVASTSLRMKLIGANPQPAVRGLAELPGKSNYFIGDDPSKWRTNVPTYGKVEYRDVYPGVSLVHYGNQQQLEYDFVVSPGADPGVIEFEAEGAERIEIDDAGDLVMHVPGGQVRQH